MREGRWKWYGLALVAFLLALLGKTAVVMLPVVLLGCVWWNRGKVRWKDLVRTVPFFVLSLFLGLVTIWFQFEHILKGHSVWTKGFLSRVIMAGEVPWIYLSKVFWPVGLTLVYPKWSLDSPGWISYLPGIVLLSCLVLFWQKRNKWGRPLLFALGYFLVMLLPVSGLLDQGFYAYTLMADHWQYYAIVGGNRTGSRRSEEMCAPNRRAEWIGGRDSRSRPGPAAWVGFLESGLRVCR
jgi:hypothetical protein